jgi:hypothetical protein
MQSQLEATKARAHDLVSITITSSFSSFSYAEWSNKIAQNVAQPVFIKVHTEVFP